MYVLEFSKEGYLVYECVTLEQLILFVSVFVHSRSFLVYVAKITVTSLSFS